jgi:ribosomal protein S18 acetylase RimI-like enzyme
MSNIAITRLSDNDIGTIFSLAHRIWHIHYPGIITVEQIDYMLKLGYSPEVIRDEIMSKGVTWLAIMDGDNMIGFASAGSYGEGVMKLHKLYLLPEYHGRGIGARALNEVEHIAQAAHAARLVLNVNKHNTKAIQAYQRAGWCVAEEVCVDIGNGFVMDDYVMVKDLGCHP